jgi:Helicase associated domain
VDGWTWNVVDEAGTIGLRYLQQFCVGEKHARVPQTFVTDDGFRLGIWTNRQRIAKRRGKLESDRQKLLEALPDWTWEARADRWEEGFGHLQQFVVLEGHARVSSTFVVRGGFKLGVWVTTQRTYRKGGSLSADRIRRLERVKGWSWDPFAAAWEAAFEHLQRYAARIGHAEVPVAHVSDEGFRLGSWVNTQRNKKRLAQLPKERLARLAGVPGWVWVAR